MIENLFSAAASPSSSQGRGPASLKQRAYEALKAQILSGALPPGMLLSERQLAGALQMSKTPVHAALERLEADGLVTVGAQQGIVVRTISPRDMVDHFEIREAIEPFVVSRLAGRLNAEQIRSLNANLRANRRAVRSGDVAQNVELDAAFHLLLCEFLGNREITRVMAQIRERVHAVIRHISLRTPERMALSLAEHESISHSILSGDGSSAASHMTTHLHNGLQTAFQRSGFSDDPVTRSNAAPTAARSV